MFIKLSTGILIAAAVIPAAFLLFKVYRADRLEKEPPRLLISLVLLGILTTLFALVSERLLTALLSSFVEKDTTLYNAILYFGIVAFSEEGFKYIALKFRTWRSPSFDCQFDGAVYAVFVSLGFALFENIEYVFAFGLGTALTRAVTAIPGHACFGVFMGAWYGIAKKYETQGKFVKSKLCRVLAVLLSALTHGAYDFIATLDGQYAVWIFVGFIALLFSASLLLVRHISRRDAFLEETPYTDDDGNHGDDDIFFG